VGPVDAPDAALVAADRRRRQGGIMLTTKTLLLIAGIALLIFGPAQLPELGKTLGRSIRTLQDAMEGKEEDADDEEG
jgi:sec-independent protein translocase protein TatA